MVNARLSACIGIQRTIVRQLIIPGSIRFPPTLFLVLEMISIISGSTKYFVDRVNKHWLNDFKVDGFRFDFTKGFTNTPGDGWAYDAARISILERMANVIWSVDPQAYVILEHFAENSEEIELSTYGAMLWGNMNHKVQ